MNAQEQAAAIFKNGEEYGRGFWDGLCDLENKRRDRAIIGQGELFCLPKRNKWYRAGYAEGRYFEHGRPAVEKAVYELIQKRLARA